MSINPNATLDEIQMAQATLEVQYQNLQEMYNQIFARYGALDGRIEALFATTDRLDKRQNSMVELARQTGTTLDRIIGFLGQIE